MLIAAAKSTELTYSGTSLFMGPFNDSASNLFSLLLSGNKFDRVGPARASTVAAFEGAWVLWLLAEGPS